MATYATTSPESDQDKYFRIWQLRCRRVEAPVWESEKPQCAKCFRQFTMFFRHHHCRYCGKDRCGECCNKFTTIPQQGITDQTVRVCDDCFQLINLEKAKDLLFASLRPIIAKGTIQDFTSLQTFLLPGSDIDAVDEQGRTLLMETAQRGIAEIFLPLLHECNASVVALDNEGRTVLMYAAMGGEALIVREIINQKIDIDQRDRQGVTAHGYALQHGHQEIAELLVAASAKQASFINSQPQELAPSSPGGSDHE